MPTLPALISRPLQDAVRPPATAGTGPAPQAVQQELSAGLPARIDLDAARSLVLAVPLGVARAVIAADPSSVVFDTGAAGPADGSVPRDGGGVWPRLTLVVAGAIGETVPVVLGVPFRLAGPAGPAGPASPTAAAVVEVTVDRLVVTAGTLRSAGRFGSRLSLRWRDLTPAPDDGPPSQLGDPGLPLQASVAEADEEGIR